MSSKTKVQKEIYKPISGYKGTYEVSNLGNVRSLDRYVKHYSGLFRSMKGRVLTKIKDNHGYPKVNLSLEGKMKVRSVHQLVAEAFLNHTPCGYKLVINHKDFNPSNNHVDNLEIVTQRENTNQKHIKSSSIYTGVGWDNWHSKWKSQITINGKSKHLGVFNNELDASKAYQKQLSLL